MDNQGMDDREKAYSITSDDEQPLSGDRNPSRPLPAVRGSAAAAAAAAGTGAMSIKTTVNDPAHPTTYSRDPENLDYRDRDPTRMNDDVRVMYEDVIAEPEGSHSFGAVWRVAFIVFTETKQWSYRILTGGFGVILGILWGFLFALMAFAKIWLIMPAFKMTTICLQIFGAFWKLFISTILDPLFLSISHIFSGVNINMKSGTQTV
ncbi:caveolin-1-like isoform X1 [Tubulanus polymorphus]|uniref:caveolin-1-like isoform X1 n=1 Tax=Tubulanus polymorphus TaxID=672921 RepID=UPI003DA41C13